MIRQQLPECYGSIDADILNERIVTYRSDNAPAGREWVAYIDIGGRYYLPGRYEGTTEAEVLAKARSDWDENRAERERRVNARREATKKAKATKAKKAKAGAA